MGQQRQEREGRFQAHQDHHRFNPWSENCKKTPGDKLTVICKEAKYHFVPSNPWVAVNWRSREEAKIDLTRTFAKRKIRFIPVATKGFAPPKTASNWRTARGAITTSSSSAQAPNLPS
jgi:hypothetical protein